MGTAEMKIWENVALDLDNTTVLIFLDITTQPITIILGQGVIVDAEGVTVQPNIVGSENENVARRYELLAVDSQDLQGESEPQGTYYIVRFL